MKKIIIGIVIAAVLVGGIVGASVLYKNLSTEYNKDNNGGFQQLKPVVGGTQITEGLTTEKVEQTTEKDEQTTEKVEQTTEKVEQTTEENEEATEKTEQTTEKLEQTTEKLEQTTEKVEQTIEKVEIVFSAPDFTVLDWEGESVKLSDFAGKPIVLNFWATWCYYCKVEMPEFDEAAKELSDVQFVMVNATSTETMAAAKNYIESNGFDFDVFFDTTGSAQHTYGVSGFPTTFFISADGSEVYYISGMIGYDTLLEGIALITD